MNMWHDIGWFTVLQYAIGLTAGCLGALVAAGIVAAGAKLLGTGRRGQGAAFITTFFAVFAWVLWVLFAPNVNFRIVSESPDGCLRLTLEDVSKSLQYDEIGWRLKAKLDSIRSGECLVDTVIQYWTSGFDDQDLLLPDERDVAVHWSQDGQSALIEYGGLWRVLPGDVGDYGDIPRDMRERYKIREQIEQRR